MTTLTRRLTVALIALLELTSVFCLFMAAPRPASAASLSLSLSQRDSAAYHWALTQAGKWYAWGGTGPSTYDCSGLVYAAYRREGITIPRTTYEMLRSSHLVRVTHPIPGDLAFYGNGSHVEFYTGRHDQTFGAHRTGQRISYITWTAYWHPTEFMRVV